MARIDVPTLQCDRCKKTTQNLTEMAAYPTVIHYHMSGEDRWDLCPRCWRDFTTFLKDGCDD